ncbi:MAG: ABC transporter ATP-binding protein [Flavobacteriales bacterium]|nr:ABC transporter ATP-binding protein [Flavobacteriales bacterium]
MAEPIITVEGLSKSYVLRHQQTGGYTALRDVMANKVKGLFKASAPDPTREEFFALKDVSFEVNAGDRVGIIGRNGAGKSTLLKILSRITEPSQGRITLNGRVASLLEVGTGFHPELTGRENIYLNGSILGMSKAEIRSKFDEIVAFSEVEKFLDTPVKRYSSGMYVRLAFAVAAHLEPEILIVDEVLAVGDAEFQRKCLGKMEEVSGQGRTILFVSHQMDAVQRLCNKGLLLNKGVLISAGTMQQVVDQYLRNNATSGSSFDFPAPANDRTPAAWASGLQVENAQGHAMNEVPIGAAWQARIPFTVNKRTDGFVIALGVSTMLDLPIRTSWSAPQPLAPGNYEAVFMNDGIHLADGQYKLVVGLSAEGRTMQYVDNGAQLTISDVSVLTDGSRIVNTKSGLLVNQMNVNLTRIG